MRRTGFIAGVGLLWMLLGNGCNIIQPGKTSAPKETYEEDLSAYRPEVIKPEPPAMDSVKIMFEPDSTVAEVSQKLDIVLDTVAAHNRASIRYIDGFTIQVYGGDDRTLAKEFRLELLRNFPETEPRMVFEQPNYKVRVGEYYTRLEAQELFVRVKKVFPKAILIPKRIYIR